MKSPITPFVLLAASLFFGCHSSSADERTYGKDTFLVDKAHPDLPPPKRNPEMRAQVKKEPVAEYRETTGRPEGDFIVRLYQTSQTMAFRVDLQYEGLPGDDTVRFPDLGTEPHPVLQKGADRFACIIGFQDNDKQFREMKLVHAKGNQLKISTLRHWVLNVHYRLVSE